MRKVTLTCIIGLLASLTAWAQIQMPQPSPAASVIQTVGLTEVRIDYSSPAVKDRKIWGDLEEYGVAWRAGANAPTKITFSHDVKINDADIPAGSYNIFITPMKKEKWKIHLNKTGKSVFAYTKDGEQDRKALEADDIITLSVEAEKAPMKERLAYYISADSDTKGTVTMHWEKVAVSFSFITNTDEHALASIKEGMEQYNGLWYTFANSANYYIDNGQSADKAMEWVEKAIALRGDHFYPHWVKAKVLAAKGEHKEAIKLAKDARKMGKESGGNFYASMEKGMESMMKDWRKDK